MHRWPVVPALVVAAVAGCLWPTAQATSVTSSDRPNVVFILADDLGYGDTGVYGQRRITTPHIDRLASEGIRFTDFYAGSPVCAPSRAVLMTGLHTGHVSVRGNAAGGNLDIQTLQPNDRTFVQELKAAGYATGLFGKWGLGEAGSSGHPNLKGFDESFGFLNQTHAHNYYPSFLMHNATRVPLRNVPAVETPGRGDGYARVKVDYAPAVILDRAMAWVETHRNQPFFLYLSTTLPHANNEARRATGNGEEVPDLGPYTDEPWTDPNKGHAAMVRWLDNDVGTVMARLTALGLDRRTMVIFTSDNGPHNEGGNDPDFFDANGPYRGLKRSLTDGGIRVPLLVRWPGHTKAGTVSSHVAYFGDIFATLSDLIGKPAPPGLDSISLLPTLEGRTQDQRPHEYLYWEFYEQGGRQAVRIGPWKVIREPMFRGAVQVYDLVHDPGESTDLVATRPDMAARGAALMDAAHRPDARWVPR